MSIVVMGLSPSGCVGGSMAGMSICTMGLSPSGCRRKSSVGRSLLLVESLQVLRAHRRCYSPRHSVPVLSLRPLAAVAERSLKARELPPVLPGRVC
ncbi:hypothetical protein BDZ91DRAFT_744340 [Kalaharituber pfeilii]|nr:hypothetical protein BDZ91DRAFT_744340 [Kalaharituber pfeilii]